MSEEYQHVEAARRYDAGLVALEAFTFAGLPEAEHGVQRAAMLHAYATRIGALIATGAPTEDNGLVQLAQERIVEAIEIVRILRS